MQKTIDEWAEFTLRSPRRYGSLEDAFRREMRPAKWEGDEEERMNEMLFQAYKWREK